MNTKTKIFLALVIGVVVFGIFYLSYRSSAQSRNRRKPKLSHTDIGDIAYVAGDVETAIAEYDKSSNPEAKITQALIIANDLGNFDEAEIVLADVAAANPEYNDDIAEIIETFALEQERREIQDMTMDPDDLDIMLQTVLYETAAQIPAGPDNPPIETRIRNDPQNVHDHFVQNDFRKGMGILKSETAKSLNPAISPHILNFREYIKDDDVAVNVYNHIADLSKKGIAEGGRETPLDIMNRTFQVAKTPEEEKNIFEEMRKELRSAVGPGGVVCLTGINTRIFGALEVVDDRFKLRPEWAVRDEIMGKVAKYRDEILAGFSDEQRTKYNGNDMETEDIVRTAAKKMFNDEYKNLMSESDRRRFDNLFDEL